MAQRPKHPTAQKPKGQEAQGGLKEAQRRPKGGLKGKTEEGDHEADILGLWPRLSSSCGRESMGPYWYMVHNWLFMDSR